MTLKDLFRLVKFIRLIDAVFAGIVTLKSGKAGDAVAFSGVRLKVDGVTYEVKGVIVRLD